MRILTQSTARNVMVFMTDSTDHITGKASLTLTITASKDGGAFSSISPTVTDRGSGWYELALTTSHTDTLGDLVLHITGTGADPTDVAMQVVLFNLYTATPDVNVAAWGGAGNTVNALQSGRVDA